MQKSSRNILAALLWLPTWLWLMVGCSGVNAHPPLNATDTPQTQQLPFAESKPLVVPANTVIYVRLQQSLSSATAQPGQDFSAVLDEPLQVDGQTAVARGAAVTGKVLAARESGRD